MRPLFFAILITTCVTIPAAASWVDFSLSEVTMASDQPVSLFCSPDGTGMRLDEAAFSGSDGHDATIQLVLIDWNGQPVAGFPAEDMWLDYPGEGLVFCEGGSAADTPTDAAGRTTFIGALSAGGHRAHVDPVSLKIMASGSVIPFDLPDLAVNSSDLNGDLVVDLTDVVLFTEIYRSGSYDYALDFHFDGDLNLSDLVVFAGHRNTVCP